MVARDCIVHKTGSVLSGVVCGRQHDIDVKVGMRRDKCTQLTFIIDITLFSNTEVKVNRVSKPLGQRCTYDRHDGSETGATGRCDDRTIVILLQGCYTERAFEADDLAHSQLLGNVATGAAAGNAANMKLQYALVGPIRHAVAARRLSAEVELGVLPRRKCQRRAIDLKPQPLDVVCRVFQTDHAGFHLANRRGPHEVNLGQPSHRHVRLWPAAAWKYHAGIAFRSTEHGRVGGLQ
jgi:hypothetical protein